MRLIPSQFVRPFVKSNKNDYRDAEAIAEAVKREEVSGDTLLRHLRRMALARKPVPIVPRVLGIDDWVCRKGQR